MEVQVLRNVQYGSAYSDGEEKALLLDIYRPANQLPKAPAILLIHGGNFMGGSKDWNLMVSEAYHFARAGFVVFNIDYRIDGSF